MIYCFNDKFLIRAMGAADPQTLCDEEIAQGWHSSADKFKRRIADSERGKAIALVAEYEGNAAGYINVYKNSAGGPFANMGYCEIVDFGVLEKYRNRGMGSKLMDIAERIAAEYADTACLGVGLHAGYGSAQRMYFKRGYIPDGSGVWYGDKPAVPYGTYRNDDYLILYLSKKLR